MDPLTACLIVVTCLQQFVSLPCAPLTLYFPCPYTSVETLLSSPRLLPRHASNISGSTQHERGRPLVDSLVKLQLLLTSGINGILHGKKAGSAQASFVAHMAYVVAVDGMGEIWTGHSKPPTATDECESDHRQ